MRYAHKVIMVHEDEQRFKSTAIETSLSGGLSSVPEVTPGRGASQRLLRGAERPSRKRDRSRDARFGADGDRRTRYAVSPECGL
jgi:hypothetical protein